MGKSFVGIGFGPIQSGLFLLEAFESSNFDRLVVAEVVPEIVAEVRRAGGDVWINVAKTEGVQSKCVNGLAIYNPHVGADAAALANAIAAADEIVTALPSVEFYTRGAECPAELLARGLRRKLEQRDDRPLLVYAAENHNHAAELLRKSVWHRLAEHEHAQLEPQVQFVNTVIGKMSGVATDAAQIERDGLRPIVVGSDRAVLVEQFNRILIGRVKLPDFERGLAVFQEKDDLLPFEEAKLYGHNAAHAVLGYLAQRRGITFVHDAADTDLIAFVEQAFVEESGGAICKRYAGRDEMFTPAGWMEYVRDLLVRMVNPFLRDRVDRVIRDPRRKLGWHDRLVGTMRLALGEGIAPRRYAIGAAAAVEVLLAEQEHQSIELLLADIWGPHTGTMPERRTVVDLIERARDELAASTI